MPRKPERDHPEAKEPSPREAIIAAFMALLGEKRIEEIGFAEIARRAGLNLALCRTEFGDVLAILAAHAKEVDRQVLAGGEAEMAEEPPRERLFDVMMRRLDALAPHKPALRSLLRSVRSNPPLACALNLMTVRSMQWMLTAADIDAAGPRGMLRAQGLALLHASMLRTFVVDDDPGLARTLAALDRGLARGAQWAGMLDDLLRLSPSRLCRRRRVPERSPTGNGAAGDAPAAA